MQSRLQDEEREKNKLVESNNLMEERIKLLERKLQSDLENGNVVNQEKINEINDQMKELMKDRNQYYIKALNLEREIQKL